MSQPPNLRDLLVDRRDELILRVNQSVEGYVVSGTMTRREVEDHLPELIDQIVAALSVDLGQPPSQPPTASRYTAVEHGQQRLRVGFSVEAVMYEYDILRETIFDLAEEAGVTVHRWESRLVSESIDRAAFVAVREYQRQRDDALEIGRAHV